MRRLITLALLLGLTGCAAKVEERKHVVCLKTDSKGVPTSERSYSGVARGNVFVINNSQTFYLVFTDEDGERIILDLSDKQCGIN